jgi:ADP-heptose:LPS heptosyltransferase/GT2 family glycosyltransferase
MAPPPAVDAASKREPEAVPATQPGAIRVELNAELRGWTTGSRFDVVVQGQITASAPAESFSVHDSQGQELVAIQFGQGDAQETVALSGGETAYRTGFQVFLPMPGGQEIRIADLWVRARARDGAIFEEGMRLGCMNERAAILAGPAHDLSGEAMPRPGGMVYIESAEIDHDGMLLVDGWTLTLSPIVAVQIFVDGDRVGAAAQGGDRPDLARTFEVNPNAAKAGFSLRRQLSGKLREAGSRVTAQVLCLSGACLTTSVPLARPAMRITGKATPPPVSAEAGLGRSILLACDRAALTPAGALRIEGWAASGIGIERIAIEIDGRAAGDAMYGTERADVVAEHPEVPINIGFTFQEAVPDLVGGTHEVCIVAFNPAGDRKELTLSVAVPAAELFRVEIDGPETRDGVAVRPITGRLVVEGWALARDGVDGVDIALDGTLLGHAHHGTARPDVAAAFPDWDGAARGGFTFHCPSRALPDGEHVIQIITRSKSGGKHVREFRVEIKKIDDPEAAASIRRRVGLVERNTIDGVLARLDWRPRYHLIVTGDAAADEAARALTIGAIVEQAWDDWRVTMLASGKAEVKALRASVKRLAGGESARFAVTSPPDADLARVADADLVGILAIGDELGRDALGAFAVASGLHREADCFYADEFRRPPGADRPEAFFKPDFSPTLLLSMNYIGRPLVVRPALFAASGVTAASLMRDGFHDLTLRCTEAAAEVCHVTELLSRTDFGVSSGHGTPARALRDAMARRGVAAEVLADRVPETWHVRRTAPLSGKVSIIIPTCAAKGYIETCLKSLREVTKYKNIEIVCVDNIPKSQQKWKKFVRGHADRVVTMPTPFNWSRFNNEAAAIADGEYLLFLNDDIEIIEPGWLDEMLEAASWPGVGIVGARLLYPNRTVQHAGMFLGDGMGRHAFRHAEETDGGYFGLALTRREVIAVTGACLLVRRDIFEQLGRFDEAHDIINNDMDFCLRAHRAGVRAIYTPHATLIHHELASRGEMSDRFDTTRFTGEWRALFAAGDPYFNPRLSRHSDDYLVDDEGVRAMYSGHPLFDRSSVRSILVVKVDHIGDFITALPAIRRLKMSFPDARITALVAPASVGIATVEPAIDECISFEFFFERSELGEVELTEADLDGLRAKLAPYRFDIAIDMRKHMSTRTLLRCSGARVLAGYDMLDEYPWLDIALEWEGDKALQRKRGHIVDDLINLAQAVADACQPARRLFDPLPEPMPTTELPPHVRHLFVRPVVAIHPGSGNVMRRYPEKHIPPLIDLLIARDDVSVLLIGGRDDAEVVASIMAEVARPDRIASVAGQVGLRDLPRLLAACALFIGGNSGPKHIAAGAGIPTIGIHSGVVDPGEWGPIGERAVALYRDMSCAPCFLAKPEHCPRGLACVESLEPALVHRTARMFLARPVQHHARKTAAAGTVPAPSRKRGRRVQVAGSR